MASFLRPLTSGVACCRSLSTTLLRFDKPKPNPTLVEPQFFDFPENFGKMGELRPKSRPGRSWTEEELRLKSNSDLHKLWYVCLKERNMLLTMFKAYASKARSFPNPERIDRVNETMRNVEAVVHERNDAYFRLETGDSADMPKRKITSFMGFTYEKSAEEHYLPPQPGEKEYEVPYLDDDAYMMQKLWNEKEYMKELERQDYERLDKELPDERRKFSKSVRKWVDRVQE